MNITENQLQTALWRKLNTSMVLFPNFRAVDWFEADVWAVSKHDMAWEFEIKVSRADFRKDASKAPGSIFVPGHRTRRTTLDSKYARLASGDWHGPNNFVYVAPAGVIPVDEVPAWAGLWEFGDGLLRRVLKSQRLHKVPVPREELARAKTCIYHRYWNDRIKYGRPSRGEISTAKQQDGETEEEL